jgi:SAM-dependent methyltransferase
VKISEATALIRTPLIEWAQPQSWCDLGCGSGTFTAAIAKLLVPGSTIHAVDLNERALESIPDRYEGVEIRKVIADLESASLRFPRVDGILIANALHFIREQHLFLKRLLSVTDRFLIIEYERSRPNPWGPYPVGFERLCELFRGVGVDRVDKVATKASRFGGMMYSAFANISEQAPSRLSKSPNP